MQLAPIKRARKGSLSFNINVNPWFMGQSLFWFSDQQWFCFCLLFSLRKQELVPFVFWAERSLKLAAKKHPKSRSKYSRIPVASISLFTRVFLWLQIYKIKVY